MTGEGWCWWSWVAVEDGAVIHGWWYRQQLELLSGGNPWGEKRRGECQTLAS